MKINDAAKKWIESQTKSKGLDPGNQGHRYQVLIEGFWSGELDLNQESGTLVKVTNPSPRTNHVMSQAISMAIMSALTRQSGG
jgi:hypothetical protein